MLLTANVYRVLRSFTPQTCLYSYLLPPAHIVGGYTSFVHSTVWILLMNKDILHGADIGNNVESSKPTSISNADPDGNQRKPSNEARR